MAEAHICEPDHHRHELTFKEHILGVLLRSSRASYSFCCKTIP